MQLVIVATISLLITSPAYAYLDPGTGSFIIQAVIGALAGALFFIKTYWANLKLFFSRKNKENEE